MTGLHGITPLISHAHVTVGAYLLVNHGIHRFRVADQDAIEYARTGSPDTWQRLDLKPFLPIYPYSEDTLASAHGYFITP